MTTPAPYPAFDGTELCATENPELWFPSKGETAEPALRICHRCDWATPCLAYALTHTEKGVWGGVTEDGRTRLRSQHHITAIPAPLINPRAGLRRTA